MGEEKNELSSSLSLVLNKNGKVLTIKLCIFFFLIVRCLSLKKKIVRKTREMKGRGKTRSLLRLCSTYRLLYMCYGKGSYRRANKSQLVSYKW